MNVGLLATASVMEFVLGPCPISGRVESAGSEEPWIPVIAHHASKLSRDHAACAMDQFLRQNN